MSYLLFISKKIEPPPHQPWYISSLCLNRRYPFKLYHSSNYCTSITLFCHCKDEFPQITKSGTRTGRSLSNSVRTAIHGTIQDMFKRTTLYLCYTSTHSSFFTRLVTAFISLPVRAYIIVIPRTFSESAILNIWCQISYTN